MDVVIIGGGVNGLVAGAWMASRKLSVTIVEQHPVVGGAAVTTEFVEGFRSPTLSHALGPISRDVIRALRLDRSGIEFLTPDPSLTAIGVDHQAIVFHRDPVLTAGSIATVSKADASRWADFLRTSQRIARLAAEVHQQAPPPIDGGNLSDWWRLAGLGRKARALGRRDLARVARWVPMAVADLTSEWFESDLLQAAVCAHAIFGNPAGPWSAGTGGMFLQRLAADPSPVGSGVTAKGGPGAMAEHLATVARTAGATVRTDAHVARILIKNGRTTGIALDNGDEIAARVVVAAIDPKQALLDLVPPVELPPTFRDRIANVRARGVTAKINFALLKAPVFHAFEHDPVPLRGRLVLAPDVDYLERAFDHTKYGEMSEEPWLEVSVPSVLDPSLAPEGRHVASVCAHFAPRHLRGTTWDQSRNALARAVIRVLERHAPGFASQVVGTEVFTPEDLERRWGLSGGHIFHGESSLDQTWIARPLIGWASYRTPVAGLYLGSAGVHPGGGLTGLPGLLAAQTVERDLRKKKARST
jgi:phytoene dehydrogenase-like protein